MLHGMARSSLARHLLAMWVLASGFPLASAAQQPPAAAVADRFTLPATDEGLPGAGPIRRYDWFQNVWRERRSAWASRTGTGSGRGRLPWRLDYPGLGGRPWAGLSRGQDRQSRDQRRHVARRVDQASRGRAVAEPGSRGPAHRHQRSRRGRDARDHRGQPPLILAELKRHNPQMPVILCEVFPSSASKKRPADQIKAVNALYLAAVKNDAQVLPLETWRLFADPDGDALANEFPDLLHPNVARLHQVGSGAPSALRDPPARGDHAGRVHAGRRIRKPVQRPRPDGLGLPSDVGRRQGEREEVAGVGSERAAVAHCHRAGRLRRPHGRRPTGASSRSTAGSSSRRRPRAGRSSSSTPRASSATTSC